MFIPAPKLGFDYKEQALRNSMAREFNVRPNQEGWMRVDENWTSPAAVEGAPNTYTVNVPFTPSARFTVGERVRLKRNRSGIVAQQYFYIATVTDSATQSTLSLVGGDSYTLAANDIITDIWVSRELVPYGFPASFSYTAIGATDWTSIYETWTYASATTITVSTDATTRFQVGDKIRLTQTTVKYFYVVAVAATTLTVTGGSDYTVANAAITSIAYSRLERPFGFPDFFSYTPTIGNVMGSTIGYARFSIKGKLVSVEVEVKVNAVNQVVTVTCPTAVSNNNHAAYGHVDGGSGWKTGLVTITKTGATINFQFYDGTNINGINLYVFGGAHYEIG